MRFGLPLCLFTQLFAGCLAGGEGASESDPRTTDGPAITSDGARDARVDSGHPDGAALDAQLKDAAGQDAGVARPDAATPDAANPDGALPDAELDSMTPDSAEAIPDAVVPDATEPDATEPDAGVICLETWGRAQASPGVGFVLGGQAGWTHDEGHAYGYFNTYDELKVGGEGDTPRKVHVFLPRRYLEDQAARFPVIYMNDGHTTFWPGGIANLTWGVADTLSALTPCDIEPVIIVAVHSLERNREYTHEAWADNTECCAQAMYANYVADNVKGFVDAHYRTIPDAARTLVVGSSHGGLAAFAMAGRRPDRFGQAAAMSPSFWVGLDYNHVANPAESLAGSALIAAVGPTLLDPVRRPKLWIDWGLVRSGGEHNSVIEALATARGEEMVELLERTYGYEQGVNLKVAIDPLGGHDERSWGRRFEQVLRAFYGR